MVRKGGRRICVHREYKGDRDLCLQAFAVQSKTVGLPDWLLELALSPWGWLMATQGGHQLWDWLVLGRIQHGWKAFLKE